MRAQRKHLIRAAGLAAGLALAAATLAAGEVPRGGGGNLGTDVTLLAGVSGELEIVPTGAIARGNDLKEGEGAQGTLRMRNQTGTTLDVHVRALPSTKALDDALRVRARAGRELVYYGTLGALKRWSRGSFRLAKGERAALRVGAVLSGSGRAVQGRIVDVSLEFKAVPRRRR